MPAGMDEVRRGQGSSVTERNNRRSSSRRINTILKITLYFEVPLKAGSAFSRVSVVQRTDRNLRFLYI
jgi:hypothetical protein